MDSLTIALGCAGGVRSCLTAHSFILAIITSIGLSVDVLTALSSTHYESEALNRDRRYVQAEIPALEGSPELSQVSKEVLTIQSDHVCWGHNEKDGGNAPQRTCSHVPFIRKTSLNIRRSLRNDSGSTDAQTSHLWYRTLILTVSKSILPLLQWILLMDLGLGSDTASGVNQQLAKNGRPNLFSEYVCLAIVTIAVIFFLFFAAWTFRRQGLHWIVYWSCLPLFILATSWVHVGGSPANFALIQLPLCISVGTSLAGFQHMILHRYQSGHPHPRISTTVEKTGCHSYSEDL